MLAVIIYLSFAGTLLACASKKPIHSATRGQRLNKVPFKNT